MKLASTLRRGDFWAGLLALVLALSIGLWGDLVIDVNLHDTYYVVSYAHLHSLLLSWLVLVIIAQNMLHQRGKMIGRGVQATYLMLSFLTTLIYLFQVWGPYIATSGLAARYFSAASEPFSKGVFFLMNFFIFLMAQGFFTLMFFKAILRRR